MQRLITTAPPIMPYNKQLAAAKKAVSMAARLCQKARRELSQGEVQAKSDKSLVTVADYGSQALVTIILEKELPSMPFSLVAEEDSHELRSEQSGETIRRITELVNETLLSSHEDEKSDHDKNAVLPLSEADVLVTIDKGKSEGGPCGQHWVLDPIDGTKGYLRRDGQYAIALALLDEGKVVLGVLACPNLPLASIAYATCHTQPREDRIGCLFYAQLGSGTYMQCLDGSSPAKVHVSNIENAEVASFFESFEVARSSHSLIASKLGVKVPPVRIDSQAKYGALSRGDGAIYMRFAKEGYREKIWDHAAGYIVVTEAGGVATDAAGKALDFSTGRYLDLYIGIIVTNQKLMPALLKAIQEAIKPETASLL